jgi:hypothetical protein
MKMRLASISDAGSLAKTHLECALSQEGAFMPKLGERFLRSYYKIFLSEKNSVIIVAEDCNGMLLGFSSGTTDAREHSESLRANRIPLGISLLLSIITFRVSIRDVFHRYSSLAASNSSSAITASIGPRGEYWAWRPSVKVPGGAALLRKTWCNIMRDLGCKSFQYELDLDNSDLEMFRRAFNCSVVRELALPDGRRRVIVEESLRGNAPRKDCK